MKKKISILGSTGSIGKNLLNIIKKDKKNFEITLLTARKNYKLLLKQANNFNVTNIIITDLNSFKKAKKINKNKKINIYNDFNVFDKIFRSKIDYTMSSIIGLDGLYPTLEIIKYTKIIAIANKEAIICGWDLIKKKLKIHKTKFLPVDSEHFSIWKIINYEKNKNIDQIFLTASGGPFLYKSINQIKNVSISEALKHPNWKMGKKISIDSATMMNKVFELIEAKKIFDFEYNKLKILVHTQSYIHAIVKFSNGLTKILIHDTNMKFPIFNSLYENTKKKINSKDLDLSILNNLDLSEVNIKRFPTIKIIKRLPLKDSLFETVLVSANDALVDLFLNKQIKFTDISKILLKISNSTEFTKYKSIEPKNIQQISKLVKYVSLKIYSMSV